MMKLSINQQRLLMLVYRSNATRPGLRQFDMMTAWALFNKGLVTKPFIQGYGRPWLEAELTDLGRDVAHELTFGKEPGNALR